MKELEEIRCAPWASRIVSSSMRNNWIKMQLEDEAQPPHAQRVRGAYWVVENGQARREEGLLPEDEEKEVYGIFAEENLDDLDQEERRRSLGKRQWKKVQRALKDLVVSEVFSQPRVAQEAQKMGMKAGTSFDLVNGYDLRTSEGKRRCWEQLKKEDPDLVVVCPPCGPFSSLQRWNYPRMQGGKAIVMLAEAVEHLEFSMKIYEWQVRRKKWAIFEHPSTSMAWKEECVQRVLGLPGVQKVRADQCQYGLHVGGGPNRKPTDFMVTGKELAKRLSLRCSGAHEHVHLLQGLAKKAQEYPKQLCVAMLRGLREEKVRRECPSYDQQEVEKLSRGAAWQPGKGGDVVRVTHQGHRFQNTKGKVSEKKHPKRSTWIWNEEGWKEVESYASWCSWEVQAKIPEGPAPVMVTIFHGEEDGEEPQHHRFKPQQMRRSSSVKQPQRRKRRPRAKSPLRC